MIANLYAAKKPPNVYSDCLRRYHLSKWSSEALTLAAGCAALFIGLAASVLIRFPETDSSAPVSATSMAAGLILLVQPWRECRL